MVRFFTSLIVTVVIMTTVVIAWTPVANSGPPGFFEDCLDYCEEQAICQCAKILGGSLRLTICNINAICGPNLGGSCECTEVDPICKPWEKDVVTQKFPADPPFSQNCN